MLGPVLSGERVVLAPATPDDLPLFCAWFADREITRTLLTRFPLSLKQEDEWYQRTATSQRDVLWAIRVDGGTIGNTGLHGIDWVNRHAISGTLIGDRSQWGKGYATEAVHLRTAYAFDDLGLERLESESLTVNVAMHRALEHSGYRKIATRRRYIYGGGEWHDAYLFELLRDEWTSRRT
jgi:RimJ/RimL family protein N-acetyltransferase